MEDKEKLIVTIADLSTLIDKSPRSIEHAIARGSDWLPPGFKMGKRWCWLRKDIESHLAKLRAEKIKRIALGDLVEPSDEQVYTLVERLVAALEKIACALEVDTAEERGLTREEFIRSHEADEDWEEI